MDKEALYVVIVENDRYYFDDHIEFCNFMSENSDRLIQSIEKLED